MDMLLTWVVAGLGTVALGQAVLLWRATRSLGRLDAIESRVGQFGDALGLLTDTTESAFRAVASEIARTPAAERSSRATTAARTSRVLRASRRGKSVDQIAASEEMAESEVRLRLHLANDVKPATRPARRAKARKEGKRGSVRVG